VLIERSNIGGIEKTIKKGGQSLIFSLALWALIKRNIMSIQHIKKEFKPSLKIAMPIMMSQIGVVIVSVVDNIMIGDLGKVELAAASLANSVFFILFVFSLGMSHAIAPMVSSAMESDERSQVHAILYNGIWINVLAGIILMGMSLGVCALLPFFDQPPEIISPTEEYLLILSYSFIPISIFWVFKQFVESMHHPKLATIAVLSGNALNIVFNFILIKGLLGFPAMGIAGAGLATLISRVVMVVILIALMTKSTVFRPYMVALQFQKLSQALQYRLIKLGLHSGLQSFFEVSAFSFSSVMAGWISTEALAAHQIALNLSSITYIVAIGLGVTTTIRVGNQMGAKNYDRLRTIVRANIALVMMIMMSGLIVFFVFKEPLARLYSDDTMVVSMAMSAIVISALFQISDGLQLTLIGTMRGMQDVLIPTLVTFLSYWGIALPMGYWFGVKMHYGVTGLWIALLIGLTVASVLLFLRFRYKLNKITTYGTA